MDQRSEEHWRELSEEILTSMKEWRRSHPKATLREIEDEVHARMSRLEAQMIPRYGTRKHEPRMEWKEPARASHLSSLPDPLTCQRETATNVARSGRTGCDPQPRIWDLSELRDGSFSPRTRELALLPGSLTPKQQDHLAHLGSWMPYARAARMLESVLGVQVSEPTVRRGTERTGAWYEARQLAEVTAPLDPPRAMTVCEKQAISTDGAYVPLIGGEWAEVRTVVIGEVKPASKAAPDEVHTHHLSYFSRMTDAGSFGDLAEVEMRRRGVSQAQAVCAVTDGAGWRKALH